MTGHPGSDSVERRSHPQFFHTRMLKPHQIWIRGRRHHLVWAPLPPAAEGSNAALPAIAPGQRMRRSHGKNGAEDLVWLLALTTYHGRLCGMRLAPWRRGVSRSPLTHRGCLAHVIGAQRTETSHECDIDHERPQ